MTDEKRSDHDVLICLEVKLEEIKTDFENHLVHHFRYSIMAWGVALGAIVTLAIALVKAL